MGTCMARMGITTNVKRARNGQLVRACKSTGGREPNRIGKGWLAPLFVVPAFVLLYLFLAMIWRVPSMVAGAYLVLSIASFIAYAVDKSAAVSGRWRTSERSLLFLGLLGGWPGGLLAQQVLRHKSSKASFRLAFWVTVILNVLGFVLLSSPQLGAWRFFAEV